MDTASSHIENSIRNNAIFIVDEKSSIVYNNQTAESLLLENSDFKSQLSEFINNINADLIKHNTKTYKFLPKTYNYNYNGNIFKITADRLKISSKKLTILTLTEIDISNNLEEKSHLQKSKTDFISNISHEFRTPLNAILGYTELLMNELQNEQQLNRLKIIKDNSKNLLILINDLIVLSKIQADILRVEHDDCDLAGLLDEIFNIFRLQLNNKGLKFEIKYKKPFDIKLKIDEVLLRQILFNLIGNAIKFTNDGSVTVNIDHFNITKTKLDLTIYVIDTGIGIEDAYKDKIFDLFSQANESNSKAFGGTGLGLAIVSRLVNKLGGKISVDSKLNEGTTFKIQFTNLDYYHKFERIRYTDKTKFETFLKNIKAILIVDDSIKDRKELINILGNETLKIFEADNAESALIMASEIKPDVIILDLRMPGMTGIEAAYYLKLNKSTHTIPIIGLSTLKRNIRELDEKAFFYNVLDKPVIWDELFEALMNIDSQMNDI